MAEKMAKVVKAKKRKFKCNICRYPFKRKYYLVDHLRTQHKKSIKKLVCPFCSKKKQKLYSTKGNAKVHFMKEHEGEKICESELNRYWIKINKSGKNFNVSLYLVSLFNIHVCVSSFIQ